MGLLGAVAHIVVKKVIIGSVKHGVTIVAGHAAGAVVGGFLAGPAGMAITLMLVANPVF
jgi:uncharacterized protein YaaW (UPF0174 family)